MFGTLSDQMEVNVPASEAWKVYGTLQLAKIVTTSLTDHIHKIDIVQGDGGAGTILQIHYSPGRCALGFSEYKIKYSVVDSEKRVKVVDIVEGGYFDIGFTLYRVRFEVIEKDEKSCITKGTIEYEVKEEVAANASFVSTQSVISVMEAAAKYLTNQK